MTRMIVERVRLRAGSRCEYCLLPEMPRHLRHVIDHVIARKHGGTADVNNLALCCVQCNLHKGSNIAGLDPATQRLTPLFHPRRDHWLAHFAYTGGILIGTTDVGRATVTVLSINEPLRVDSRVSLIETGLF